MVIVKKEPVIDVNGRLVYYDVKVYDETGEQVGYYMVSPEGKLIVDVEFSCDEHGCKKYPLRWRDYNCL